MLALAAGVADGATRWVWEIAAIRGPVFDETVVMEGMEVEAGDRFDEAIAPGFAETVCVIGSGIAPSVARGVVAIGTPLTWRVGVEWVGAAEVTGLAVDAGEPAVVDAAIDAVVWPGLMSPLIAATLDVVRP